ncbi:Glutamate 5-kinase [Novipirellula galeiformis]|uniref:Glutamate 5-kinase n=1 Tax=Novipirellula galeiformis TaxID=2528004 RepID=A0A5C6CD06_9BACT|nr:glutamate 5-kinase [Novipirellula galeiformis]TWU22108.1 Glutamate 5-kinase [Novipirellula galeiformis]
MDQTEATLKAYRKTAIENAKCVVVKVGTRVLTTPSGKLDRDRVAKLSAQLCRIADTGRQTVMVSSGAVGAGVGKLGLANRPKGISQLQAVAAIGQTDLIQAYESSIAAGGHHAAQVLLTASDLRRRSGYLHVRNALSRIHDYGAIAIVNENDSVAVRELMTTFGDNDRLAARVAGLLNDTLLIILSDVDGLYDGPPRDPKSKRLQVVHAINDAVFNLASDKLNSVSKGGMTSKLEAAKIATSHGHTAIIAPGHDDEVLDKIFALEPIGTLFPPTEKTIRGRRRWIGGSAKVEGILHLDRGAVKAVWEDGRSLLAVGIRVVKGTFRRGAVVALHDPDGNEIARGLSNYRSTELEKIMGKSSDQIGDILGHCPYENAIHRDNLVLTRNNEFT